MVMDWIQNGSEKVLLHMSEKFSPGQTRQRVWQGTLWAYPNMRFLIPTFSFVTKMTNPIGGFNLWVLSPGYGPMAVSTVCATPTSAITRGGMMWKYLYILWFYSIILIFTGCQVVVYDLLSKVMFCISIWCQIMFCTVHSRHCMCQSIYLYWS